MGPWLDMVYRAVVEFCNDSIDLARDPYSRVHSSSVRILPFDAPLGAEVIGFDLSQPLDADTFARIHQAHLDCHVLVFREQRITPAHRN
ncbi:hypothetical protein NCPPB940_09320 [Xanthomonas hortorum pv. taraxaci]|nr:hypothetical protein NCPPB940_09320 [Xanthomonas hortorum pv. taraxaci]CAD0309185.1 hypothetical protein NCPPB940_09320 [Xanthomonas hortorum pv. taraxaci]